MSRRRSIVGWLGENLVLTAFVYVPLLVIAGAIGLAGYRFLVAPGGPMERALVEAVPGNMDRLNVFRSQVLRHWFRALRRRSQRRPMTWARFLRLVSRWIPSARILHPHPNVRFDAIHPR